MKNNKLRKILRTICIVVFLVCLIWLVIYFIQTKQNEEQNQNLVEDYLHSESIEEESSSEPEEEIETPVPEDIPEPNLFGGREYPDGTELELPDMAPDFDGLKAECEDIYAWLYIPQTKINYPILQAPEDKGAEYYLRKDIYGKKDTAGCIFTQYYNRNDWLDHNTIIYGHNMRNGSMFADLHCYEDPEFVKQVPYIYIYTPDNLLVYETYCAVEHSNEHLMFAYDYNNQEEMSEFLEMLGKKDGLHDLILPEVEISAEDYFITLSTCVTGSDDKRYLVVAKLVAVSPTDK